MASAKNSEFDSFERNTQELQTDKGAIVNTEIKQLLYKAKNASNFKEAKRLCLKAMSIDKQFKQQKPGHFLDYEPYEMLAGLYFKYGNMNFAIDNYNNAIGILSDDILNNGKLSLLQFKKQKDAQTKQIVKEHEQKIKAYKETFFIARLFKTKPKEIDYNDAKRFAGINAKQVTKVLHLSNMLNNLALAYYMSGDDKKSQYYNKASKDIKNYTAIGDRVISRFAAGNRRLNGIYN